MKRYKSIIVNVALDDRDATTLAHAARFAQAAESEVVYITHVAPSFDVPAGVSADQDVFVPRDEEIEQRMHQLVAERPTLFSPQIRVEFVSRQGAVASELMRLAAQKSADLLCIGRMANVRHDSLSDSVGHIVRKTPCSVFVIPAGRLPDYRRILVPLDFSETSLEVVDVASSVASVSPGATITVQHVYKVPTGYHKTGCTYEEFASSMKSASERQWNSLTPKLNFRGIPWTIRFDLHDHVDQAVAHAAEEVDAGLLVIGSHGRTRPAAVLLGHVADSICLRATRPLLCVKKKGEMVHLLRALLQVLELE